MRLRSEDGRWRLAVSDNGPGITSIGYARHACTGAEQHHGARPARDIWLPGRTTRKNGTGLGLTIVRDAVADLGGSVDAREHGALNGAEIIVHVRGYVTRLVERVRPRVVVFPIGRARAGTPDPAVVRHLRQAAPEARIICTQLSRHCAKSLPTIAPGHL